jgi:hypothetical protein
LRAGDGGVAIAVEPAMRSLGCVLVATLIGCTVGEDAEPDFDADPDPTQLDEMVALISANADLPSVNEAFVANDDHDGDGIPDELEELLLRRYRPYYKFSAKGSDDETYRPANPITEIENYQLKVMLGSTDGASDPIAGCGRDGDHHMTPPESLYTCRNDTNFAIAQAKTRYCLNIANADYHGVDFATARANATGFYGHVAQTKINGHDAFKIEYWQFFAFNNQDLSVLGLGSPGDHEGDWTSVQLWFDRELHRLVKVRYLIHGKEATFTIPAVTPACRDCMVHLKGPNYNPDPGNFFSNPAAYSDNAAEFYVDANKFKHVVVYIERGAHEFWPGPWGYAEQKVGALPFKLNTHNGNGTNYLVPAIKDRLFNMGEAEKPLTRAGKLILSFDGHWGCTNSGQFGPFGSGRRSPVGPALHCEWTWPHRAEVQDCEH